MRKLGSDVPNQGNTSFGLLESEIRTATNSIDAVNLHNKGGAFVINVSEAGNLQIETATVVGTVTGAGNCEVIITGALVAGSPLTIQVPVLLADTNEEVAEKIRTALDVAAITDNYTLSGATDEIILTTILPAANDATLNIDYHNGTCTGLTNDLTSTNTQAGSTTIDVTPKIQGKDEINDVYYDILTGVAITAAGSVVLKVFPDLTAVNNTVANDIIPQHFRLVMTHGDTVRTKYTAVFNSNR